METDQIWEPKSGTWPTLVSLIIIFALQAPCSAQKSTARNPQDVFPPGETLVYDVQWSPPSWMLFFPAISAGEITLTFQGQTQHQGTPAFKITAAAISSGFFPKMGGITITDSFESIVAAPEFCSYQMSKKVREGKRQRDILLTFDHKNGGGHYLAYDVSRHPPVELNNEPVKNVPSCVQDLLSAIYYTRLQDLKIGRKVRLPVSDNGIVKEIEVRIVGQEMLDSAAGRMSALRTEAVAVFGGIFQSGGALLIWVSNDERKVPLKFEAKVKLGRVSGTVKKIDPAYKS